MEISYSELQNQVVNGNVTKVVFEERRVSGDFKNEFTKKVGNQDVTAKKFTSMIPFPSDPELLKLMKDHDVLIEAKASSNWGNLLIIFASLAISDILLDIHACARCRAGRRGFSRLANPKPGCLTGSRPKVTFADVAGCDEAKQELAGNYRISERPGQISKTWAAKFPKARCFWVLPEPAKHYWPAP